MHLSETSSNRRAVRSAFDRAAASYDAAASLQQEVARRLDERLTMMKLAPKAILDAGCGTGQALPMLRARYPQASLFALDLAANMLKQARAVLPEPSVLSRVSGLVGLTRPAPAATLVCADIEQLPLARNSLDMVWSNLALQWMDGLEGAFREMHRALKPEGLVLFSSFGPDTLRELRSAFAGLDGYGHVNRFVDMHDIGDMLVYAGFKNPVMEMEYLTLTYTELKALLRELKAIGAHTVTQGRRHGLMGRAQWRQFEQNYERFRRDGRLPATYEIIYGHAWAGPKDWLDDGRQVIQMKISNRKAGL
jgi:malonyl-CoA O-methyltransferase